MIRLRLSELEDLGGEFMRWEMATAVACHYLGVNPFNQPDVESSKIRTRRLVDEYRTTGKLPIEQPDLEEDGVRVYGGEKRANPADSLAAFLSEFQDGGYFGIQVFAAQSPDLDDQLNSLSHLLRDWTGLAATVGYGPRFLHSTGQLHKGGLKGGRYLQLVECPTEDLPIPDEPGKPESSISFGALMQAQAMGDRHALIEAGRRVWSCHFSSVLSDGLRGIIQKLEEIISRN